MIEKLYKEYYDLLLNYCMSMTRNRAQAEDIIQETFVRAMENIELLEEMKNYKCRSWLYTTARRVFIDRYRRLVHAPKENKADYMEDDLSMVMVQQLCSYLPEDEKMLFWLRYLEGYNATELGRLYDMPASTVRSKLSHARKMIAGLYEQGKT